MSDVRQIPVNALRLSVGEFELGDNGDGAKTAPFRMVARSGQPIEHWYWGRIVHDLSGVRHKSRIPIDYAHSDFEVIGYANHFDIDTGDLIVKGALVPYKDSDRASEVVHKFKAGVPYEASINFGGDGLKIQNVAEGEVTNVNGFEFSGPGVVVREWPLRGVAVCPYGADANTSTEFNSQHTVNVEFVDMPKDKQEPEALGQPDAVESQPDPDKPAEAVEPVETPVEEVQPEPEPEIEPTDAAAVEAGEMSQPKSDGLRFLDEFGTQGAVWFAEGRSFEEAAKLYRDMLRDENAVLKQKLAAASIAGVEEPVSFSEAKPKKSSKPFLRIAGKRYD